MRRVTVTYHHEDGSWWADSADVAGLSAVADSFSDLHTMVAEGLSFYLDGEPHQLIEQLESGAVFASSMANVARAGWYSRSVATGAAVASAPARQSRTESQTAAPQSA